MTKLKATFGCMAPLSLFCPYSQWPRFSSVSSCLWEWLSTFLSKDQTRMRWTTNAIFKVSYNSGCQLWIIIACNGFFPNVCLAQKYCLTHITNLPRHILFNSARNKNGLLKWLEFIGQGRWGANIGKASMPARKRTFFGNLGWEYPHFTK